jgi:DNA-binding transcriptional LysR family regulator
MSTGLHAMLRFTLRQLQYFIAAADSGSLTEASKQVHVAQPAIASAIKKLEEQLSVDLIVRHHAQGISLTPPGRRLLADARSLLRHGESFQEKAFSFSKQLAGELALGCYRSLAPICLPRLLDGFSMKHPDIKFIVTEGVQAELVEGLSTGKIELALTYDINLPEDIELSPIYETQTYVLLPHGHELTNLKSVSLAQIANEPLILLDMPSAKQYFNNLFEQHNLSLNITHTASSLEVLRGMVGRGLGVSVLATRVRSSTTYDGHRVEARPITESIKPSTVCVARLRDLRLSVNAEEFGAFCTSPEVRDSFTEAGPG